MSLLVPWQVVRLWVLLSLAALLAGVLLAPAPVLAQDTLNHAGLVVRDGEGRLTYAWVPFAAEEIDGIELLKLSGLPVVTVGFGALGEGVCAIAGEGCGVGECRRTVCQGSAVDAPYWQFFRQEADDPSQWTWQPLGASATRIRDGDVFGWSWTGVAPGLPALTRAELIALAGAGDGEGSVPAVRTVLPTGVVPMMITTPPDTRTTATALAILTVIAATGLLLAGRRRPQPA
jgi:hypothetical protein